MDEENEKGWLRDHLELAWDGFYPIVVGFAALSVALLALGLHIAVLIMGAATVLFLAGHVAGSIRMEGVADMALEAARRELYEEQSTLEHHQECDNTFCHHDCPFFELIESGGLGTCNDPRDV